MHSPGLHRHNHSSPQINRLAQGRERGHLFYKETGLWLTHSEVATKDVPDMNGHTEAGPLASLLTSVPIGHLAEENATEGRFSMCIYTCI